MENIHLDNINEEAIKKVTKEGIRYKLKRVAAAGLVVMSMVSFLTGCGAEKVNIEQVPANYTYFSEEDRARDYVYLSSDMTNTAIDELAIFGDDIKTISVSECYYIDDLSDIVEYCPNLEKIEISNSPSISDLSFIYAMPNLKEVYIKESGFVTPELVEYLNKNGIKHNITQQDLDNAEEIDRIISEIIRDGMTDEEKIQAITYYVIDNYHYKITKVMESNYEPLSSTLKNKGGVCASYAYLTNTLMRKAGIKSYEIVSHDMIAGHAWNIIELEGKYYYLDATNIKQVPFVSKLVLKYFNKGFSYMTDPKATSFSPMVDYDKVEKISIPPEMIEDIERGESEKNIIEKYGSSVPARVIEIVLIGTALSIGMTLAVKGIGAVADSVSYKKYKKSASKRKNFENEDPYNMKY